ncbi:MAG TPA: hypothetical protein VH912_25165 [Streptosporangiaceae bacterium]
MTVVQERVRPPRPRHTSTTGLTRPAVTGLRLAATSADPGRHGRVAYLPP